MVCLIAAQLVQFSVSAGNGWPHNALWHHWLMPISCHLRDYNALLVTSLTHVSGAIASVQCKVQLEIPVAEHVAGDLCVFVVKVITTHSSPGGVVVDL